MSQNCSFFSRLPLENLRNLRDLGGHAGKNGAPLVFGRVLRSDAPLRLTPGELEYFANYPLCSVFDLRSHDEIDKAPSAFHEHDDLFVRCVPLLGTRISDGINAAANRRRETGTVLSDLYIHLLEESQRALGQLFNLIAQSPKGAVLVHCTHGKDRTGLVCALLLLLAGVADEDIIASYQVSYTYLKAYFKATKDSIPDQIWPFLTSDPENMEITLNHFHRRFGSIAHYLTLCGVSQAAQENIQQRLLQPDIPEPIPVASHASRQSS